MTRARRTTDKREATHRYPVVAPAGDGYRYVVASSHEEAVALSGKDAVHMQYRLPNGLWEWIWFKPS